jgi:serine/threonine-protein kinase
MLAGRLPFTSTDPEELARLHRETRPTPPRQFNNEIPPALEQIMLKVLLKEPAQRYRSADQLGRVLRNFSRRQDQYSQTMVSPSNATTRPGMSAVQQSTRITPMQPAQAQAPHSLAQADLQTEDGNLNIDWLTILLGLLAALAVGGLIPFWLYVYLSMNPPGR